MLNEDQYISHHIFSNSVPEEATRDGYGKGLVEIGSKDSVVVLSADLEESTRCHWFKSLYPERFIECGVAEQNMAAIAAGLGISGKIPFINSYATFSPGRNLEQIRTTIAYNDANVKIAGHHTGVSTGPDGATHQALEDIALMRTMPNMKVVYPGDTIEAQKAVVAAASIWGPIYIRLQREKTPIFTTKESPFVFGKVNILWEPKKGKPDVAIFSTGPRTYEALCAARELEKHSISSVVVHAHTISPLDQKTILTWAKKAGAAVSVEEHSVFGGFGSALAELFAVHNPIPMECIGVQGKFGQSGTPKELEEAYGLTTRDIVNAARRAIKRK